MKRPRFVVYEARGRLLAANNRIIADSGEAYTRESDAKRATSRVMYHVARIKSGA